MSSNLAIHAINLRKAYHLYPNPSARLKQIIAGERSRYYKEFVALENVSFDLMKGEVLGIIGCNGAGKSTLLQLLCGTLAASSGELKINGRIAALLELGAGFNPEFSGRENIYLSAAVMGIKRVDIDQLIDDIIDFSGIRPFIDQPVKTYSSGMYVRLAFSVATSVDPEILIIDEALSVGDGDFARRSFDRIMAMRDAGKTILFCSHALYQIEVLCTRVVWLDAGKVIDIGDPNTVVPKYQNHLDQLSSGQGKPLEQETPSLQPVPEEAVKPSVSRTRLISTKVFADGIEGTLLNIDSDITTLSIEVNYSSPQSDENVGVAIVIHSASGLLVSSCGSWNEGIVLNVDPSGYGTTCIDFAKLPLLKGRYTIGVLLFCEVGLFLHDEADPVCTIDVNQLGVARGLVNIPHQWKAAAVQLKVAPIATAKPQQSKLNRWRAIDATQQHESMLLTLFKHSFGHSTNADQWRWKYRFATSPGTLVLEGDRAVAFNGGMPRTAYIQGVQETAVQMGDVMVTPDQRGILTRRGPFYLSVMNFFKNQVGQNKNYSLAFGFPNARHAKLGMKQGLYCQVDKIVQARWPALTGRSFTLGAKQLTASQLSLVDPLWNTMKDDALALAICARDAQWIEHRYFNKPGHNYLVFHVFHRITRQTHGVIVLKPQGEDGIEILDIIAPKKHFPNLIKVAQMATHRLGLPWLFGWFSPQAINWASTTNPIIEETDVVVPGSAVNDEAWALRVKDRWWLMGGDTDFK
jgi:ABC-type polysaccharide/polyol phosphate transport system ATPase subunit